MENKIKRKVMETTINKIAILKLKESIKNASEKQKFYKNQRKTVKLKGEREISPDEATYKHQSNRGVLRIMYAAYAIMRGKDVSSIDNLSFKDHWLGEEKGRENFLSTVNRMVENYEKEVSNEM